MTHILSNLTEAYYNIVKILKEELDDKIYPLTSKSVYDKILEKLDQTNLYLETNNSIEYQK